MKTWTFLDKSKWPVHGPWTTEPDKAQWIDEETGLDCLMVRAHAHWCGYVGVPEGHPAFGKEYDAVEVEVHGGLTFADVCQTGEHEPKICHVPESGRPDRVWWLGFDCAHSGDYRPPDSDWLHRIDLKHPMPDGYETYRSFDYVREECGQLARQLHAIREQKQCQNVSEEK